MTDLSTSSSEAQQEQQQPYFDRALRSPSPAMQHGPRSVSPVYGPMITIPLIATASVGRNNGASCASVSLAGKYRKVQAPHQDDGDDDCIMEDAMTLANSTNSDMAFSQVDSASEHSKAVETIMAKFMASSRKSSGIVKGSKKKLKECEAKIVAKDLKIAKLEESVEKARLASIELKRLTAINITSAKNVSDLAIKTAATQSKFVLEKSKLEYTDKMTKASDNHRNSTTLLVAGALQKEAKVAAAINEVHYTQLLGMGSRRGFLFCQVAQATIMATEEVFSLVADCLCNCIVKKYVGAPYLLKKQRREQITCLGCRAVVTDVVLTTGAKSEETFAWRALAKLVKCESEQELIDRHILCLQEAATQQTVQDTAPYRATIEKFQQVATESRKK